MTELRAGCLRWVVLGVLVAAATGIPLSRDKKPTCGYEACTRSKTGMLNVHLVPHSHDDVGWLKTVDQYYYGHRNGQQKASVQYTLDSVVVELQRNPSRKFIQVETIYFARWWKEQDEPTRQLVRNLVQNGQLEFTGGGWSMNDEANTNYQSIIDQFTLGYRFLNDTFGSCGRPRVAWQIDPFGHSRGFGLLVSQLGLDAMFLNRIEYADRDRRMKSKTPEMIWKTSPNLGIKANLFASILYNSYDPPRGFCFDDFCGDDPFVDDKESPDYNVESKIKEFEKIVERQAGFYPTPNILLTMGDDFHYSAAGKWYKNLDKLIRYVNAKQATGGKINVFYSTPACYVKALNDLYNTWYTKSDDFFPFAGTPHTYFAGYFTSRPAKKYMERLGNNLLQVAKQLSTTAKLSATQSGNITVLKEAMGVLQHHDAITGTERQHVANDYVRIITKGYHRASGPVTEALRKVTKSPLEFKPCFSLNISHCDISGNKERFVITVYNPLGQKESSFVRIPVQEGTYRVRDAQGVEQNVQLVPIPDPVKAIPGRQSNATYELVFYAEQLPPLGFRSYYVDKKSNSLPGDRSAEPVPNTFKIGFDGRAGAEIDRNTGLLKAVKTDGTPVAVYQTYLYWTGKHGDKGGTSDSYVFRPVGDVQSAATNGSATAYKGPLVQEIHQTLSDWVTQVIRLYANSTHVEFVWQVGPVPIEDGKNKEPIVRFLTDFNTNGVFYTDANGREVIQRKRDFRPTWNVSLEEKVAGNYYPVTSRISIRDDERKQRVSILTDRAQGGSSLHDGEFELMIHRRLATKTGVIGEALNETAFGKGLVVRGTHLLYFGDETVQGKSTLAAQERIAMRKQLLKNWLLFSDATNIKFEEWQKYVNEFSGLADPLPANVHLLTLEQWTENSLLVRLEHFFEKDDDPELSKAVTVDLKAVLKPFKVVRARETILGGNQWLSDSKRLVWTPKSTTMEHDTENEATITNESKPADDFSVYLSPMEIRTFIVEIQN